MRSSLAGIGLLFLLAPLGSASEQAGPNPANLSPQGSHGVSLFTGAFTYSYPIVVPPGRRGIQPNLSLLYNSQAQNGWLGIGWNLSLGAIKRSTRNGIPSYNDSQDTFIMEFQGGTQQLVRVSSGTDATGAYTEYRAQIESAFLRTRYYAPNLWVVTSKDGVQYQFEGLGQNTNNSKYFYWGLTKVFDPLGNFMQISYPSLSSATTSGTPGPGGTPVAVLGSGGVVGYMPATMTYTGKCTPGTCQSVTQQPLNQIVFSYELRPDTITTSIMGGQQVIVTRLKGIQTTSNGNSVKAYQLTFSTNAIGNSMLACIVALGSDGVSILSTTTFSYEAGASYSMSISSAYALPVNIATSSFVDANGDGLPDIVQNVAGIISSGAWLNTGSGWHSSSTWIPPDFLLYMPGYGDLGVRFADLNGDGLQDVLQSWGATTGAWINNGFTWASTSTQWAPPTWFTYSFSGINFGAAVLDVNADGLPDIAKNSIYYSWNCNTQQYSGPNYSSVTWLNSGGGWASTSSWTVPAALFTAYYYFETFPVCHSFPENSQIDHGVRFVDLNGDRLVDILQANSESTSAWLNTGSSWTLASQWNPPAPFLFHISSASIDTGVRIVDINGDGLSDIVQYTTTPITVRAWLNSGGGWVRNDFYAAALSSISTNALLQFADMNGDGVVDVIAVSTAASSNRVYLGQSAPFNGLVQIKNGFGGQTQVAYGFSPPSLEMLQLPPVTTIRSVAISDGIVGDDVVTSSYGFSGGRLDGKLPNREFLGFAQANSTDSAGNFTITSFYQTQTSTSGINVFKGLISEQASYRSSGSLLTRSTFTVSYSTPFSGVYYPITAQSDTYFDSKHSAVAYSFDAYGNITQERDFGDVDSSGDERTIVTNYAESTGPYLVALPIAKRIFSGLGTTGSLLSQASFYFDSGYTQSPTLGLPTKNTRMLVGGADPVVISSYDSYGNLTDTYDPLYNATSGAQGNHTRTTYETTFNQFPQSTQRGVGSALGLPAETFSFDSGTGQMLSHVDVNGTTTTYTYDVFGRISKIVGPGDQVTSSSPTLTYEYVISSPPPHAVVVNARVVHGASATVATYSYFDGLGRKIQTKSPGTSGKQVVSGALKFSPLGLAATAYNSFIVGASTAYVAPASTQPRSTFAYDGLGRLTSITDPAGAVSTKGYQGWTEIDTDSNGHSRTYVKNAYGQIIEVDEQMPATSYATLYRYDLLGNLTGITNSLGQGTTLYYDSLGRKTTMADPQLGQWTYQYDQNGNLLQQTDAKIQTITMTYDALSRQTFKIYPDSSTVSYSYDAGSFGKGRLSEVVDLSGSQEFSYDVDGNVILKTRDIGGTVYVSSMAYDALGRETSLTYPDGIRIDELYDGSALSSVQSASNSFAFATLSYSTVAPMKVSGVVYGNGMTSQYAYDPTLFRLASLKALAAGATLQSLAYQYDSVGNITQITDSTGPMTQFFTYDALDRLLQSSGPYGTNNYEYDSIGNLAVNPDKNSGSWGFADASDLTAVVGTVVSSAGRIGNGLGFDGGSRATLNGTSILSPPTAISIALWLRPTALGSGYVVSKSSAFYFPQIQSDGSLDAALRLSSGLQIVNVSSGPLYNLWRYFVLTYDGTTIKVYVNGQLWKAQSATGTLYISTSAVVLGSGFTGGLDELSVYPYALSADQILQRYQLYPILALNEPSTPDSLPGGMAAGVVNTTYTFNFTAWDLNGNDLWYRIDWGTGAYQDTVSTQSGSAVQATHTWTSTGTYSVRVQAVQTSTVSAWSPLCNILIVGASIQSALDADILVGASANAGATAANTISNSAGEAATGQLSTALNAAYLGYQSSSTAPSVWAPQYLGRMAPGGADAPPSAELPASDLVNVQYTTAAVDVSTIALNLLEHGATTFIDANGNLRVSNGRWIAYDYENRPIRIVTQDAVLVEFAYDFKGNRTRQIVTPLWQSSQTTTYVGGIFDKLSTSTVKYVTAGSLRAAMLSSDGTTTYFLPDQLGSTNLLVDASQNAVRTTRYMPFGSTLQTIGTLDDSHKFTGQVLDAGTGLYYFGARFYDPQLGRFTSPDIYIQAPYDPQSLNRYGYVRNNPVSFVDPDGHFWFLAPIIGAAIFSGVTGGAINAINGGNLQSILTGTWQGAVQGGIFAGGFMLGGPIAGPFVGGMLSGAAGGALSGGGFEGAFQGATIGALTAGISAAIPVPPNVYAAAITRIGVGGLIGGGMAGLSGGDFVHGVEQGALSAATAMVVAQAAASIGAAAKRIDKQQSDKAVESLVQNEADSSKPLPFVELVKKEGFEGTDFVVSREGYAAPVPIGAIGPLPTRASGFQFLGGAGGHGFDSRVTGMRFMDPNRYQGARVIYMNVGGQTVNPFTGRTDIEAHFYLREK